MNETWEEAIDRLVGYRTKGTLIEKDYDEVAEKFSTTREEVIQCCISRQTDIDAEKGKFKD